MSDFHDSQPSWMFDPSLPSPVSSDDNPRRIPLIRSLPPPPNMGRARDSRSLNKLLRPILEASGTDYGDDVSGNELSTRLRRAEAVADNNVGQIVQEIEKARRASLCFVVDATGSMAPYISGVRKCVAHIVNVLVRNAASNSSSSQSRQSAHGQRGEMAQRFRGDGARGSSNGSRRQSAPNSVPDASSRTSAPGSAGRPAVTSKPATLESLELAFVGYRDIGDEELGKYPVLGFTSDVGEFLRFIDRSVRASGRGGGDFCEDALWGLNRAMGLRWNDANGTRIVFHIADQPCHGRRFHEYKAGNRKADRFPDGVAGGPRAEEIFEQFQSMGIQYYFGKITKQTDKMIRVFSQLYGDTIGTYDVGNPENIQTAVMNTVQTSVDANVAATKAGKKTAVPRSFQICKEEPRWDQISPLDALAMVYELPSRENFNNGLNKVIEGARLDRTNKRVGTIKVALHPFAAGSERIAYYGCHYGNASEATRRGIKVVLKEYRYIGKGHNSAFRYEQANEIQTVASFMAIEFNQYLRRINAHTSQSLPLLKFLKVKTVCLSLPGASQSGGSRPGTAASKPRFMCYENYLRNTTKFVRFTNNVSYAVPAKRAKDAGIPEEYVDLVMAFCHWTYRITNGFLMVVDLEGCLSPPPAPPTPCPPARQQANNNANFRNLNLTHNAPTAAGQHEVPTLLLTDPAIHCTEMVRYAPMNLGKKGMELFLETHECNRFCAQLLG